MEYYLDPKIYYCTVLSDFIESNARVESEQFYWFARNNHQQLIRQQLYYCEFVIAGGD